MIPKKAMSWNPKERTQPIYWYWYKVGQKARRRDMASRNEVKRIQGPTDAPKGAPRFGSSAYYSFLDGYFLRHGFL